jgi:glycosyltransferase involved in cell wall biosynthesis
MAFSAEGKVLLTAPDLKKMGGVASYCRMLQPYVHHQVDYLTVGSRTEEENKVSVPLRMLRDYLRFHAQLTRGCYQLVHLNPSLNKKAILREAPLISLAKARGCKVLVFIHGWNDDFEDDLRARYLPLFSRFYSRADAFVVLASEFRRRLTEMGVTQRIYVETTAVEERIFSLPRPAPVPGRFQILFLARLEKEKGIYEALNAFSLLRARHPQATLLVAGDGSELAKARTYAEAGRIAGVEFCGYLTGSRKDHVFSTSDLFLFPTWHGEGMPINLLEAMAYGLPAITCPVGGIKDFFQDEVMGFLAQPKDPVVLAERAERLLLDRDRAIQIGNDNRMYAMEHFSIKRVSQRVEGIYRQMLQG